jgi:hypothetical protein
VPPRREHLPSMDEPKSEGLTLSTKGLTLSSPQLLEPRAVTKSPIAHRRAANVCTAWMTRKPRSAPTHSLTSKRQRAKVTVWVQRRSALPSTSILIFIEPCG